MTWIDLDPSIVRGFREVAVPTVVDVLDYQFGIRNWMNPAIKPIARARISGRAVTVLMVTAPGPTESFAPLFEAVDECGPDRVIVVSNGGNTELSCMGDLVVTALDARGTEGAVMDGAVRDIDPMLEMGFPIFAAAVSPVNFADKASVVARDVPITCGGAEVRPGDVILADWDGVVVIPQEHAEAVLEKARAVEADELALRDRIRAGGSSIPTADYFAGHYK